MNIETRKWKEYIKQDAINGTHEFVWIIGFMYDSVTAYWENISKKSSKNVPSKMQNTKKRFKQELGELLICKKDTMQDIEITDEVFDRLNNELYKLLSCSLTSKRTADEIATGLQDDISMRNEVVDMVVNETKTEVSCNQQRLFLNRMLSGDNDLRVLLNKQQNKEGFPYII